MDHYFWNFRGPYSKPPLYTVYCPRVKPLKGPDSGLQNSFVLVHKPYVQLEPLIGTLPFHGQVIETTIYSCGNFITYFMTVFLLLFIFYIHLFLRVVVNKSGCKVNLAKNFITFLAQWQPGKDYYLVDISPGLNIFVLKEVALSTTIVFYRHLSLAIKPTRLWLLTLKIQKHEKEEDKKTRVIQSLHSSPTEINQDSTYGGIMKHFYHTIRRRLSSKHATIRKSTASAKVIDDMVC